MFRHSSACLGYVLAASSSVQRSLSGISRLVPDSCVAIEGGEEPSPERVRSPQYTCCQGPVRCALRRMRPARWTVHFA
eukprot:545156-Alexandrium_andersonii.AAC.2